MKTEVRTITPELAKEILKRNAFNRKLTESHVRALSKEMRENRWVFDGQPIRFNGDGRLLDGQHRLNAIIDSGTTQDFLVVHGIKAEAFKVMDTGRNRNASDVFGLAGIDYASHIAAATKIVYTYNETQRNTTKGTYSKVSSNELLSYYNQNPRISDCLLSIVPLYKEFGKVLSKSYLTGYMYLCSQKSVTDAEDFFRKLCTGLDLSIESPIYILRKRMIRNAASKEKLSFVEKNALLIKAWNHYRAGSKLKTLRWDREREEFPKIK
jgi:hypothetical protein